MKLVSARGSKILRMRPTVLDLRSMPIDAQELVTAVALFLPPGVALSARFREPVSPQSTAAAAAAAAVGHEFFDDLGVAGGVHGVEVDGAIGGGADGVAACVELLHRLADAQAALIVAVCRLGAAGGVALGASITRSLNGRARIQAGVHEPFPHSLEFLGRIDAENLTVHPGVL